MPLEPTPYERFLYNNYIGNPKYGVDRLSALAIIISWLLIVV